MGTPSGGLREARPGGGGGGGGNGPPLMVETQVTLLRMMTMKMTPLPLLRMKDYVGYIEIDICLQLKQEDLVIPTQIFLGYLGVMEKEGLQEDLDEMDMMDEMVEKGNLDNKETLDKMVEMVGMVEMVMMGSIMKGEEYRGIEMMSYLE